MPRPTEAQLESAIYQLSPVDLQRLAEALLSEPSADRLVPYGRNALGQTRSGWPDAYLIDPAGRIEVIEVTRDQRNWRQHLMSDARRVATEAHDQVRAFTFVALARTPKLATLARLVAECARLSGLPPQHIRLLFSEELVTLARQPRFAREWVELLGLSSASWPFYPIKDAPIYGTDDVSLFAPTHSEYLNREVVISNRRRGMIKERLVRDRVVLLTGRSASGKTVAAVSLAVEHDATEGPAYYADLDSLEPSAGLARELEVVIATLADSGVLFVLDSLEAHEGLAVGVIQNWASIGRRAAVLGISRSTDRLPVRGAKSALATLESRRGKLVVATWSDVKLVYNRLAARYGVLDARLPDEVAREWNYMFGGDLIALSSAIARRRPDSRDWTLGPEDAKNYIRTTYLDGLTAEERVELLKVAFVWSYGAPLPDAELSLPLLRESMRRGIIRRADKEYGFGYRFVHSGLARLLLELATPTERIDGVSYLRGIASRRPQLAMLLSRRPSLRSQYPDLANDLFYVAIADDTALLWQLMRSVMTLDDYLQRLADAGVSGQELNRRIGRTSARALWAALDNLDGSHFLSALGVLAQRLPVLYSRFLAPEVRDNLIRHLAAVPPRGTAGILVRASRHRLSIYRPLVEQLADTGRLTAMIAEQRAMSARQWDTLLTAAEASEGFAYCLDRAVDATVEALPAKLIRADVRRVAPRSHREAERIRMRLLELQSQGFLAADVTSLKSPEAALLGPRPCLRALAGRIRDRDSLDPLCDHLRAAANASRMVHWRSYPTALKELLDFADRCAPAVAAIVRDGAFR